VSSTSNVSKSVFPQNLLTVLTLHSRPTPNTMAPSRALFCRITSASASASARVTSAARHTPLCLRPTSRLLSTSVVRPQCSVRHQFQPSRHALPTVRSYSQAAPAAPEPPDYLNEAELHIFNKIKGELEPVKLEVRLRRLSGRRWELLHRCLAHQQYRSLHVGYARHTSSQVTQCTHTPCPSVPVREVYRIISLYACSRCGFMRA
jgi:hypothetical protein